MNNVSFVGRLGKDPTTRDAGQSKVTGATLAVSAFKKDDPPLWIDLSAWGKTGEIMQQYCRKGQQVAVAGRLDQPRSWLDRDGKPACAVTMTVEKLTLLGTKDDGDTGNGGDAYKVPATAGKPAGKAASDPF